MSEVGCVFRVSFALRLALTGAAAGLLAGCSSSDRLSDPWSNPFQSSARLEGPAPSSGVAASVPVTPVQSRPLSAPAASASPSPQMGQRVAAIPPPRDLQSAAGWSAQGGSPVVVAQGEDAQVLAHRYGVPLDALVRTNGLSTASQIQPGTRLVIPAYNAALAASSGARAAGAPAPTKTAGPSKLMGTPPRTLAQQAESLKSANARAIKPAATVKVLGPAQKIVESPPKSIPGQKLSASGNGASAAATPAKQGAVQTAKLEASGEAAKGQTPAAEPGKANAAATETANPEFRWPARGRIIQAFKPGGNDGINIALPEGTSVKAAESGVVAYAGNELKGYGNLILIRHPNGFVSAYANTSAIEVKRGDTVKRGQTIAKSGQSGNVSTPQLHFELRKGTTPVDPTQYLAGV
ncbi:MAG: LysM peptidoglycan-binding domain-containing M23 family metallopeptidase [Beijerinckiaceae bacterium]|nr:LysM peptidoglycan-binding domain-containing M23 family metallopeptidase [Beijerinckiaceae bacterium]